MAERWYWDKAEAKQKIQDHYDSLANLFNAGKFDSIGDLYHEASAIVGTKSGEISAGKASAVKFWKNLAGRKKVANIAFKIKDVRLVSAQHYVPRSFVGPGGGISAYQATLQKVGYIGVLTSTKGPAAGEAFSGGGFHRDDCTFGFPDDESYPF